MPPSRVNKLQLMPSCMAPMSLLSFDAPLLCVHWLGSSPCRLILHHALLKFHTPHCSCNCRGLHMTGCRIPLCWYLSPERKFLSVRAENEYVGHNSSSEGPCTPKNNYLHTDCWPYSWALLKVHIQPVFYCSVWQLASTTLKCTIYSSPVIFSKTVLFFCQKYQN